MVRGALAGMLALSCLTTSTLAFERWTLEARGKTGYDAPKLEWVEGKTINEIKNPTIQYALPKFEGDVFGIRLMPNLSFLIASMENSSSMAMSCS